MVSKQNWFKNFIYWVKGWYPIHHEWNEDRWLFSLPTPIKEVQGWKNETTMRIPNFIPDFCLSFRRERQHSWPALEWSTCLFSESCCSILCTCSGIKKIIFLCSWLTLAQSLEYMLLLATASVDREHLWDQISIVKVKQTIIYVKIFVQFCVSAGLLY